MEFTSNLEEFGRNMERATKLGLVRAAEFIVPELQTALSTVNAGQRTKYKFKKTKSGRAATHSVYGSPSKAGEAPRQRTGWGKGHVGMQEAGTPEEPAVRVGVPQSAIYLGYHEAGINYSQVGRQQRPWLVTTIEKYKAVLARLFATGAQ